MMTTKVTSLMTLKRFTSKSFVSIGDVLDKVVQQHRPNTHQALVRLWELWDAAVGPEIAANARPAAFKGDLLLVHKGLMGIGTMLLNHLVENIANGNKGF